VCACIEQNDDLSLPKY